MTEEILQVECGLQVQISENTSKRLHVSGRMEYLSFLGVCHSGATNLRRLKQKISQLCLQQPYKINISLKNIVILGFVFFFQSGEAKTKVSLKARNDLQINWEAELQWIYVTQLHFQKLLTRQAAQMTAILQRTDAGFYQLNDAKPLLISWQI